MFIFNFLTFYLKIIAQIGLVRMCAFMLQTLSSSKEYSVKLNKPFVTHSSLPASIRLYAFNGTYADFLIIVSYFWKVTLEESTNCVSVYDAVYLLNDCFYTRKIINPLPFFDSYNLQYLSLLD